MEHKSALSIENLHYSYEKGNEILHGVSASFTKGKITALIGANGCGKSTLLNLIAGVRKPDRGSILLNGESIAHLNRAQVARQIAVVHQSNTAPGDLTVEKLVWAGRTPHRKMFRSTSEQDHRAVQNALLETHTDRYAQRSISALSGGQMQRVWLAMALAQDTEILLLDEITTYLDIHYQMELLHLIQDLNRRKKMTIVMVLHDINLALEFCDEVVVMKDGFIRAQGSVEQAVQESVLEEAFDVACKILTLDGKRHCIFSRKGETDA